MTYLEAMPISSAYEEAGQRVLSSEYDKAHHGSMLTKQEAVSLLLWLLLLLLFYYVTPTDLHVKNLLEEIQSHIK